MGRNDMPFIQPNIPEFQRMSSGNGIALSTVVDCTGIEFIPKLEISDPFDIRPRILLIFNWFHIFWKLSGKFCTIHSGSEI